MMTRSIWSDFGGLHAFAAVFGRDGFEFLVQRELLGQPARATPR
jgi:hypothetical protein